MAEACCHLSTHNAAVCTFKMHKAVEDVVKEQVQKHQLDV